MIAPTADRIKIAQGFWTSLRSLNLQPQDVVRQAKLPLSVIHEPVVSTEQYYAIWQAYSDLIGEAAKGIVKLATAFETALYPPAALATFHARNYRDALNGMVRYKQMCPPENLSIQEVGELVSIELQWQHAEQPGPPVLLGITLAYLLELGRRGTGYPLKPISVEFVQSVGEVNVLEEFFGCSVRTGMKRNSLTFKSTDLERPFTSHNQELLEILTPVLESTLNEQQRQLSLSDKVKAILSRSMSGGPADIQAVASDLGISNRTLQRRLSDEGTSFKLLMAQTRHEQAVAYLSDPSLEIKEVAFLVGYEDQNSFYRAFRSWEGDTPANWRVAQERRRSALVTK
ncbi:AraC family transcriptional regulator [Cohnella sp. AR92]|uniref:AraC family transcriptional regulator n=1 Tax=Cohnella sp. AR92 TaxID=648716 RepID=UPI000F8CB96A|nr:AraC family transcriptional regulator [Cohnella sp. AR92]RUS46972.1 AraC family transcriptional regulator [Cohnella sp. AR92]